MGRAQTAAAWTQPTCQVTEHAARVERRTCGIEEEQNSQEDEPQNRARQQEPPEITKSRGVPPDDGRVLTALDRFRHT